jgi:hypothetical protein
MKCRVSLTLLAEELSEISRDTAKPLQLLMQRTATVANISKRVVFSIVIAIMFVESSRSQNCMQCVEC